MKKSLKSLLLSASVAGMTLIAAMSAMAAETVNVTVPNVRGGYVNAHYYAGGDEVLLPIGETSKVPKGTQIEVEVEALDYYLDNNKMYESFIHSFTVNGEEAYFEPGDSYTKKWIPDINEDIEIDVVFKGNEKTISASEDIEEKNYTLRFYYDEDDVDSDYAMKTAGPLPKQKLVVYEYTENKLIDFSKVTNYSIYGQEYLGPDNQWMWYEEPMFNIKDGYVTAVDDLKQGLYQFGVMFTYEDKEYYAWFNIHVGARVEAMIPHFVYKDSASRRFPRMHVYGYDAICVNDYDESTFADAFLGYKTLEWKTTLAGYEAVSFGDYSIGEDKWFDNSSEKIKDSLYSEHSLSTGTYIKFNGYKIPTVNPLTEADLVGAEVNQGWNQIGDEWYYYETTDPNSMAKDKWITDNNNKFYVGADGAMMVSEIAEIGGNKYYFDEDGKLVKNQKVTVKGVEYDADEEGILTVLGVVLSTPSNATEAVKQTETVLENLDIMSEDEVIEAADMLTEALLENDKTSKLTAEEVAKFEKLYYEAYGKDNIAVDSSDVNEATGIVAAAGLKSDDFAEGKAEIEFATEWLGTSSNAQERLDVKLLVNGEEKDALAAPIEFEIDLPEEFIASYSNATIKVENVDDFEVDMEAGTIRVKISKLGLIRIVATIETPKDDNNDDDDHQSSKPAKSKKKATVTVKKATEDGSWIQDAKGWWFKKTDGTWASNGWAYLTWNGQDSWYYFDAEGYLVTGWVLYNGNWYYMHPIADGTQGHLYTGWNLIDGQWFYMNPEKGATQGAVLTGWNLINNIWYYFSEVKDSTEGMMLSNTTTPDGYKVGADGAWIQ